jgi:hypothetical protein
VLENAHLYIEMAQVLDLLAKQVKLRRCEYLHGAVAVAVAVEEAVVGTFPAALASTFARNCADLASCAVVVCIPPSSSYCC